MNKNHWPAISRNFLQYIIFFLSMLLLASLAHAAPPAFSKAFPLSTIGPGSTTSLVFTISNDGEPQAAQNLAFTDNLPAGVVIATPANASSNCINASFTAADGGSTISLTDGSVAAGGSCTFSVDVTSSTPGTHMNVSGDLTSDQGNSGPASADLTVSANLPGFSKSFSPSSVQFGGRSTLTFTIDNTTNAGVVGNLDFTDNMPAGMVVASPSNATTDCVSPTVNNTMLTAAPGTSTIILDANGSTFFAGDEVLSAGATCSVSVDIIATGFGSLNNISGDLLAQFVAAGKASASLNVSVDTLSLVKSFSNDPVAPGNTVNLDYTITNRDRFDSATAIAFTDNLGATLAGLSAASVVSNTCGGTVDIATDAGIIDFSGGTVAADGGNCSISVTLNVPLGAVEGSYPSTTSSVSATIGSTPGTFSPATETLFVQAVPVFTKTFIDNPVGAGGSTTLEFTITNPSPTFAATDIAFTDDFAIILPTASATPTNDFCGPGSTATFTPFFDPPPPSSTIPAMLTVSGASLAAGASCTFSVTLDVLAGAPAGTYPNTTSAITATLDGSTRSGNPASDDLLVVAAPTLFKSFTDDPVSPGANVTLEFTISHDALASGNATNISFTDDLSATLAGLATSGAATNTCGGTFSGTTNIGLAGGGPLAPGDSCTITVPLLVPAGSVPAIYTNTTSNIVADVGGVTATGNTAQDDLAISGLNFSKSFTDDPVIAGGTVTLEFTLDNTSAFDVTSIQFDDDLGNIIAGLLPAAGQVPQSDVCGSGSLLNLISGDTLQVTGGNLLAGSSCTFSVLLDVPPAAANGMYNNATSSQSAFFNGTFVALNPASDILTVSSDLVMLTKNFTDDSAAPGDVVTLEFTLTNLDATQTMTGINFTDDLDGILSGLAATGLPVNDVCGAGSQISGTGLLSFTGGNLAAGASCTFSVSLQVPAGASLGTTVTNTTSQVAGTIGVLAVIGDPATDDLRIGSQTLSKAFASSATPGGTVGLSFTLQNQDSVSIDRLAFSDDLSAVIPGLVATGLPMNDVCGTGSQISGTSFLTLVDANLLPGGSCTINITLQVPGSAVAGTYTNTTSDLTSVGLSVATPAAATLTIDPPPAPAFSKGFSPASVVQGATSTLTFTIDNSAGTAVATALDFTDNLPAAVTVATPANASTTCTGGSLTSISATNIISYTGGSVPAGASCSVTADVTSVSLGTHVNTTGDLTSSAGNSGTASANLVVTQTPVPVFSKNFVPGTIVEGDTSTLTFTIDNSASLLTASSLAFTDTMPAAVTVANPANASSTCVGGTLTATPATNVISYSGGSVAGAASCTLQVDVTSTTIGSYLNTSGSLTSSAGNSGAASNTLVVIASGAADADADGVANSNDICPGTVIPEGVPTVSQYAGYYALVDGDNVFDTITSPWRPTPTEVFTTSDTGGCSCEQIIAVQGLGALFVQYGCPLNVMRDWISDLPQWQFTRGNTLLTEPLRK